MKIISNIDKDRLMKAIAGAEMNTSGEIRVHLQKKINGDIYQLAVKKFEKLGMTNTELRNGVLIYVALKNKQFTVIGDKGIHDNVGDDFWNETVNKMKKLFQENDLIGGLEKGIKAVGNALKKYFPHKDDDKNELSDEISIG